MNTNIIILVLVTLMSWFSVYIDGRFHDKNKTKLDYFKMIVFTNVIVFAVIYLLCWLSPEGNIKQLIKPIKDKIGGASVELEAINESMLAGDAPF
jgi:hypothetical protein